MTIQTHSETEKKEAHIGHAHANQIPSKDEHKHEGHDHAHEHVHEAVKDKVEVKKEQKKVVEKKKEEAIARGLGMHASKKHCMYICNFIKNKPVDKAISDLEDVIKLKRAVPFKGEIPHRKGKIMSGRYPINASKLFIKLLRGLRGNALVNNLDIEKARIIFASANWASRPLRREGRKAKRANVLIKLNEVVEE